MLACRHAGAADILLLAKLNLQLIHDKGHRKPMDEARLQDRMRGWLNSGEYRAVLFETDGTVAAYALYKPGDDYTYLRQFFVCREFRRRGIHYRTFLITNDTNSRIIRINPIF